MSNKAEVIAFDREKRVYKDAYVEHFRRVRHFPALATIGTGHAEGDSIILVQEPTQITPRNENEPKSLRSKFEDTPSRLLPTDPVEEMFQSTPPLALFKAQVMCRHTKARQERTERSPATSQSPESIHNSKYIHLTTAKSIFKPSSATEAKSAIERRVTYDGEEYRDNLPNGRSLVAPEGMPEWARNNPVAAKESVRNRTFFHLPPEGVIKADRKYTQEFIRQHVESYRVSRQHASWDHRS
ncbi:hypothetical protein Poli38472_006210 [Pythium oligandrum]|uniref:Uncharacterized protein n=1 Tax=Pythium oligandrum TaxID=41045 RepID=A0A8K1CTX6_PYTOL|nr:hypothetical protein Poli38472_006210 [Pythium oligandrum]|eukprot:TMW68742.1 hypothetical protein Poli38472_006210 [Pythium oligandrum]